MDLEYPHRTTARLRKRPDYFNFQQRTVMDFVRDVPACGLFKTLADHMERYMWSIDGKTLSQVEPITLHLNESG